MAERSNINCDNIKRKNGDDNELQKRDNGQLKLIRSKYDIIVMKQI